jgi:opacity protein-like surface antigen
MRRLLLLITLALGASATQASSGMFYFGAGITSSHVNTVEQQGFASVFPDLNSTSWQVFAGFRPINRFAFEADYVDLGSQSNTLISAQSCVSGGVCGLTRASDAKAFAGYAVGFLPIPLPGLDVYGKVGLARYQLNDTVNYGYGPGVPNYSASYGGNSTVLTWGAGVQAHVGMIGGRLEYEGFNTAASSVFSLSVYLNLH